MAEENNKKNNILNYWIDIESSTPPNIRTSKFSNKGDSNWNQTIAFNRSDDLLWNEPLKSEISNPEKWIHKVFLGIFSTKYVIKEFSSNADLDDLKQSHNTCLISFLIDGNGFPIKNSVKVPDYLKSIALTTIKEQNRAIGFDLRLQEIFATWSHRIKKMEKSISYKDLVDLLQEILKELNWELLENAWNEKDFHSLAYSESINTKNIENVSDIKFETNDITSSLIVDDLKTVQKNINLKKISPSLDYYLSDELNNKIDIVKDISVFKENLDISNMPMVCWPFTGNYPLVSSQQFAVNTIFKEIEEQPVISVNGPPGTGKTTLLKDVVANIIYKRAEEIIKFKDNPSKAFKKIGETSLKVNSKNIQEIFKLDEKIAGFEIVVASSNNGAVENITKELPLKNEIDASWHQQAQYLTELATNVNEKESWGMISACLGNKNNNYKFFSNFLYSKTTENGSNRSIFDYLSKPNYFSEKRIKWDEACKQFEEKKRNVLKIKEKIIKQKNDVLKYDTLFNDALKIKEDIQNEYIKYKQLQKELNKKSRYFAQTKSIIKIRKNEWEKAAKGLSKRALFSSTKDKSVENEKRTRESYKEAEKDYNKLKLIVQRTQKELNNHATEIKKKQNLFNKIKNERAKLKDFYENSVKKPNQSLPLNSFWAQDYVKIQKSSPWYTEELNKARVELFIASMDLHKAFMIENAKKISSNLNAFKQILNGSFSDGQYFAQAVWESFFLVVPVISTTFSSFGNLFGEIKSNSIGWLLIDEAGQATPQSPVGALWRSKKAIFVGDPLQVQPVVQIEDKLSNVLLEKNNTDIIWSSTMLSAQEVADRANKFGTNIDLGEKKWVGMPLRVHRRCDDPMFSISNKIAYDGLMIFGKKRARKITDVEKVLGKTRWIDVQGEPDKESHWVPNEGKEVVSMLKRICQSENYETPNELPKLYIITPFKNISYELKRYIERESENWLPENVSTKELSKWIDKSIGTIHSFQGDETDFVFLVLGGNIIRPGAIKWVCEEPNILNVATTRAKNAFYIIGNKNIWNSGVFGLVREFIR